MKYNVNMYIVYTKFTLASVIFKNFSFCYGLYAGRYHIILVDPSLESMTLLFTSEKEQLLRQRSVEKLGSNIDFINLLSVRLFL